MAGQVDRFYDSLQRFVLGENERKRNGYPMEDPSNPGMAKVDSPFGVDKSRAMADDERECDRCHKVVRVDADNKCVNSETCDYHTRRGIMKRGRMFHPCCDGSRPCRSFRTHVFKVVDRTGYVKTPPHDPPFKGVYAVDTEMLWTTMGMEVVSVTILDMDEKPVYETLVKPTNEIVDYNTHYSGVAPGGLDGITTTLSNVQEKMFTFVCDQTILMGHSLDSDLDALKIIHPTAVDTSVAYPHPRGPPMKRGLKALAEDHLRMNIQSGEHDSREDAIAVVKLMRKKAGF